MSAHRLSKGENVAAVEVLVVEDEALIQDLLRDPLEEGGFAVHLVDNGAEALAALGESGASYSALVTDIRLGRDQPTGWDLARHAREVNPAIAVIYVSGDSGADWAANGVPNSVMINKPFAPVQVVTAVAQLINVSDAPGQSTTPQG